MSRSSTSDDNIHSAAEAMLRSLLSHNALSTSSTATTPTPSTDTKHSHSKELSTSSELYTLASTSRTNEQLRVAGLERDTARQAVEEEHALVERLKREGGMLGLSAHEAQLRITQLKRDIHAAGAKLPPRFTTGLFKAVCSTDLLFLIDTTASMSA